MTDAVPSPVVVTLEAAPGNSRSRRLAEWAEARTPPNGELHRLSCDLSVLGIWAGLADLVRGLLPRMEETRPELVARYGYEISTVLPELRESLDVQYVPLTETVPAEEKVRLYPMDRAYRILHGIMDLLEAHWEGEGIEAVTLVCDHFDRAGFLVARFFRELMRRKGRKLGLTLLLGVDPDAGSRVLDAFSTTVDRRLEREDLSRDEARPPAATMEEQARALEAQLGDDLVQFEIHLPRLIHCWSLSDRPERAKRWKAMAFAIYNHYGFYEDALVYGEEILPDLDRICQEDGRFDRWQMVGGLYNSLVSVGRVEEARELLQEEALGKIDNPTDLSRAYYLLAMLHARFLPERDQDQAEEYIRLGKEALAESEEPESDKQFFRVFLDNGLAYIRHRQGRPQEAIELCREGTERLREHLSPEEHRLHRSVLGYNIGQVYASLGEFEAAIAYYSETIEMDPHYSEYYNDRGSLYLKAGRLDEAERDFLRAIELSPPYSEVWTNLGQCYRRMGRPEDAVEAYSRSLDLLPAQPLARLGRASAYETLGREDAALDDYTVALDLDPSLWDAHANRAILRFDRGEHARALEDLNRALELQPEHADLYQNRAVLWREMERPEREAEDLRRYLELVRVAEDRATVEDRLDELEERVRVA